MITRPLAAVMLLGLTLGTAVLAAAPGFRVAEMPAGHGNHVEGQPAPQVTKQEMVQPNNKAFSLAISPDGKTLAAGYTDGSIRLVDTATGEEKKVLTGVKRGYVLGVAFTPDGKTVAGIGNDDAVRLWDAATGRLRTSFPALGDMRQDGLPPTGPHGISISPDGRRIAVGGSGTVDRSGTVRLDENSFFVIRVLDAKSGERVWSHVGRRGFMHQLVFSPDSQTLASDTTSEVKLWDARTGGLKQTLKPRAGTVWALAFSPDRRLLAGYGTAVVEERRSSWLTLWDLRSGAIVRAIEAGEAGGTTAPGTLAFSADGNSVASAGVGIAALISSNGRVLGQKVIDFVKLWDVATGQLKWTSPAGDLGEITSLVFSPDGEALFCCDSSATSRIDARTGQTRQDLMRSTDGRPR
jgi:outer membrane protein assembly factor BamB